MVFSSSRSKFDKVSPGYEAAVEAAVKAAGKSETHFTASEYGNILTDIVTCSVYPLTQRQLLQ